MSPSTSPSKHFLSPFPSLRLNNLLNHGGQAFIVAFPGCVVLKCPIRWALDDCLPAQARKGAEIEERVATESMSTEKQILSLIDHKPHPNILQALLVVPEGIFFPRMCSTLDDRVVGFRDLHYPECYASEPLKLQWIGQIISAAAWLESLGFVHGDLTPRNLLLDRRDNIKLTDFGESVRIGEWSQCGAPPHVPWVFETRDHRSEQYAIGWTIHDIYCSLPADFEGPDDFEEWDRVRFPAVGDLPVGRIIQRCWHLQYGSLSALESDFRRLYAASCPWYSRLIVWMRSSWGVFLDRFHSWMLRKKCRHVYTTLLEHGMCLWLNPLASLSH